MLRGCPSLPFAITHVEIRKLEIRPKIRVYPGQFCFYHRDIETIAFAAPAVVEMNRPARRIRG